MITRSDISMVLSGGSTNSFASDSLGGEPSNTLIGSGINNLFSDLSSAEVEAGYIDYRCFYVFNDHETETLYDSKIYISSQAPNGASIQLGLKRDNDIQTIHVYSTDPISSGSMTFLLEGNEIVLNYSPNVGLMQQNLEDAINSNVGYDVSVSVSAITDYNFTFSITFSGYKYFELMTESSNDLVTAGTVTIDIQKNTDGGPVNTFAEEIDNELIAPSGVVFQSTTSIDNSIEVASLRPGEGFPVWVKRIIGSNAQSLQNDNFTFVLIGSPSL